MGKVGYITIHNTINFGSQLQTLALYKAIESLGIDVELIDYTAAAIKQRESTLPLKEAKTAKDIVKSLLLHKNLEARKQNFQRTLRKNVRCSREYSRDNINEANKEYDTFLVGSDIVWGLNITGNDFTYMLDFAFPEKKKLSFSSSVGTKWNEDKATQVRELLSRFDSISVREHDAADWIFELTGKNVEVTCDPTMLWNEKFWRDFVGNAVVPKEKYVLVYMSDPENKCIRSAIEYGKAHKMPVYYINYRAPVIGTKDCRPTSLETWLQLFQNAEVVFSASYHGLLFSMYFHKQVFYFNWTNKSRMNALSKTLGIEKREGLPENVQKDIPIDYSLLDQNMKEMRENSWKVLREMLL